MYVIIPTNSLSNQLYHLTKSFTSRHKLHEISEANCLHIIQTIVEDSVFSNLAWTNKKVGNELDKAVCNIPWFNAKDLESNKINYSCQYYIEVLDYFICKVNALTNDIISSKSPWTVWHTLNISGDIVLEMGEDYRIIEFERRVKNDEWSI